MQVEIFCVVLNQRRPSWIIPPSTVRNDFELDKTHLVDIFGAGVELNYNTGRPSVVDNHNDECASQKKSETKNYDGQKKRLRLARHITRNCCSKIMIAYHERMLMLVSNKVSGNWIELQLFHDGKRQNSGRVLAVKLAGTRKTEERKIGRNFDRPKHTKMKSLVTLRTSKRKQ